jgi:steroid 5-alpha reductase family enzyme
MNAWPLLWLSVLAVLVMSAGWLLQTRTRNAGIVDVLWAVLVATSAVYYAIALPGAPLRRIVMGVLGGLWGLRLAWHLGRRVIGEAEDGRYAYLREHWHGHQGKFLLFFLAQALMVVLFSLPFWIVGHNPRQGFDVWIVLAALTWAVAVAGESLADRQLAAHRKDPANKGKTCRRGLWRYSRHPNYFFEWIHWFAYVFLTVGAGTGWVLASFAGPAVMLVFLYRLTGIPYTEAHALRSRGEDYARYQRSTSVFLPLPPRHDAG